MRMVGGMGPLASVLRREHSGTERYGRHLGSRSPASCARTALRRIVLASPRPWIGKMIGRSGFRCAGDRHSWDDATRKVVLARLVPPGPLRLSPAGGRACAPSVHGAGSRHEPGSGCRISRLKLADGRLDGYQYADMPDDRDTWRLVLRALDETASDRYGKPSFAAAEPHIRELSSASLAGPSGRRDLGPSQRQARLVGLHAGDFVRLHPHPWAWNEIGFGGPAYPRGFMRLGGGTGPDAAREPYASPGAPTKTRSVWSGTERSDGRFLARPAQGSVGPPDNDSRYLLDVHSRDLPGEKTMRRYRDEDEVDLVVVGPAPAGRYSCNGWRERAGAS